jgi:isochorismate pyruvate lyase
LTISSLEEVRANIDRIDREIIGLMAERGRFVHEAARFKTSSTEVEAPKRVDQVVARVRAMSEEFGLDPKVAEAVYRTMIHQFIEVEHRTFKRVQTGSS